MTRTEKNFLAAMHVAIAVITCLCLRMMTADAQERAAFTADKALIAIEIDARSVAFVDFLEELLTQEDLDAIKAWAIPTVEAREGLAIRLRMQKDHDRLRLAPDNAERLANEAAIVTLGAEVEMAEVTP